jgi:hypothetical protein
MTNYRTYLKGNLSRTRSLRQELKLRAAKHSGDPKKIVDALNQLPGVEGVTIRMSHLEGNEVFGNTKRKLDLPLGDDGSSHRPKKVNFLQPWVQTRSKTAYTKFMKASAMAPDHIQLPHVTTTQEFDCDMSQWHIARILQRSNFKCRAQQAAPISGTLLRASKAVLFQHTVVWRNIMVEIERLSRTFGFALITLGIA